MKFCELSGLFIGYNKEEDFRILISAYDMVEAIEAAEEYRVDAHLDGSFEVEEIPDSAEEFTKLRFDCDYVVQG